MQPPAQVCPVRLNDNSLNDESDVLDSLEELLPMYNVVKAPSFEEAKKALKTQDFDMAILDIMGLTAIDYWRLLTKKSDSYHVDR